jgi:hypothetical protein
MRVALGRRQVEAAERSQAAVRCPVFLRRSGRGRCPISCGLCQLRAGRGLSVELGARQRGRAGCVRRAQVELRATQLGQTVREKEEVRPPTPCLV